MYLKYSPDFIDFKYIYIYIYIYIYGFMGLTPKVQVFLLKYYFLAVLALYREKKSCGQVGPSLCYSQSEVVYAQLQGFFWPN